MSFSTYVAVLATHAARVDLALAAGYTDAGYVWVRQWCRILPNPAALCSRVGL